MTERNVDLKRSSSTSTRRRRLREENRQPSDENLPATSRGRSCASRIRALPAPGQSNRVEDFLSANKLEIILVSAFVFLFFFTSMNARMSEGDGVKIAVSLGEQGYDPCCAFPCLHNGICIRFGKRFECDCTNTGYSGPSCNWPSATLWFEIRYLPTFETLMRGPWKSRWFWWWVDQFHFLHLMAMKYVSLSRYVMIIQPAALNAISDYTTYEVSTNRNVYGLHIPKVPINCPTELGFLGPKRLPSPRETFNKLFKRKHFIPCHKGTNLYFITYAQYFTHQFFKRDYSEIGYTWGLNEGIDATIIYGQDKQRSNALRSFRDGKLKVTVVDGEDFPPILNEHTNIFMAYPKGKTMAEMTAGGRLARNDDTEVYPKWALGHPLFSMTPFLFVVGTLWMREHNRNCDMLKDLHPDWDDERLYQTARLIVTGVMIKLTLTEYVQHLSQYNFRIGYEPTVTHDTFYNYANRIEIEFVQMYHWHMMIPDLVRIENKTYIYEDLLFSNNSIVFRHGFNRFLSSMFINIAGKMTLRNSGPQTRQITESVIGQCRKLRLQSFNNYRRAFNLPPYKSFLAMCKNKELAKRLEDVYGHVDAVEFFVGMFAEAQVFGTTSESMVVMGGAWSVRGLIANPLGSPLWWRPSTFGGKKGMQTIHDSNLKSFICRNLRGRGCSKMHIAYSVPKKIRREAARLSKEIAEECNPAL